MTFTTRTPSTSCELIALRIVGRAPLPAALVDRRIGGVLCREGQRRAKAGVGLFRRCARPAIGGQATHQRRGAADRGEYREAAGVATQNRVIGAAPAVSSISLRPTRVRAPAPLSCHFGLATPAIAALLRSGRARAGSPARLGRRGIPAHRDGCRGRPY